MRLDLRKLRSAPGTLGPLIAGSDRPFFARSTGASALILASPERVPEPAALARDADKGI